MKISILLFLIIIGFSNINCDTQKLDKFDDANLKTPEALAKEYINFINNGLKFDYLKQILISEDDLTVIFSFIPDNEKDNPKLKEYKNYFLRKLLNTENSWKVFDFQNTLALLPFEFVSLAYKDSGVSNLVDISNKEFNYLENITVTAIDKNETIHQFELDRILLINDNWKLDNIEGKIPFSIGSLGGYRPIPFSQYQKLLEEDNNILQIVIEKRANNFRIKCDLKAESSIILDHRKSIVNSFYIDMNEMEIKEQEKIWKNKNLEYSFTK